MANITPQNLNEFLAALRGIYEFVETENTQVIRLSVRQFGYLPYSYQKALTDLSAAETLSGLEEKFHLNSVIEQGRFSFSMLSPVQRAGYQDASWLKREQHLIKLTNLMALGVGPTEEGAHFVDWLKYLLVLPAGNPSAGILATTIYFLPFQERDLGSAYIPRSSAVSSKLADPLLQQVLGLDAGEQVHYFLAFCQLAGHPIMYDVLPQTGRFNKMVLARPELARWFDIAALNGSLKPAIKQLVESWQPRIPAGAAAALVQSEYDRLEGIQRPVPIETRPWQSQFQSRLNDLKRQLSLSMMETRTQASIRQRVHEIVTRVEGWDPGRHAAVESEMTCQNKITAELIQNGLWTAPGGAWCSTGAPIYDGMSYGKAYPLFRHYDSKEHDVSDQANLDCLTPFNFVDWNTGILNQPVVDYYLDTLMEWQQGFNFDAFRFDHVDHIVDAVSIDRQRRPISYRIPAEVLGEANRRLKKAVPHFGALAEYMLWDQLFHEYQNEMGFDLLWGDDIIRQAFKGPQEMQQTQETLRQYNRSAAEPLSILKTYNNQDGEFGLINQYPAQLTRQGALFKFFLLKFFPGGHLAQQPLLYVDGDESFTQTGFAGTIAAEIRLNRANDESFFEQFDALHRFALSHPTLHAGQAELLSTPGIQKPIMWQVKAPDLSGFESVIVIANPQYPERIIHRDGKFIHETGQTLKNVELSLPSDLHIRAEYCYDPVLRCYSPQRLEPILTKLSFETLDPAEFHFYQVANTQEPKIN